jgi:DNA-binding transcriptional MerR regulator
MKQTAESNDRYTIQEVAKLCGLPESTLRYYETIGILPAIQRDPSSKHRVYNESDIDIAISVACLNAIGLSIKDMQAYIKNSRQGTKGAYEQVPLLEAQKKHLREEAQYLQLRQEYIDTKIAYWKAVTASDKEQIDEMVKKASKIAYKLKANK